MNRTINIEVCIPASEISWELDLDDKQEEEFIKEFGDELLVTVPISVDTCSDSGEVVAVGA